MSNEHSTIPDFLLTEGGTESYFDEMMADSLSESNEVLFPIVEQTRQIQWSNHSMTLELSLDDWMGLSGWSENSFLKQTQTKRVEKLESMDIKVLEVNGRGKKMTAKVEIPQHFWYSFLTPQMRPDMLFYKYMELLHTTDGKLNQNSAQLAGFNKEWAEALVGYVKEDNEQKEESAQRRIKAITENLKMNGFFFSGKDVDRKERGPHKTHRVTMKGDTTWLTGPQAAMMHARIVGSWKAFYINMRERGVIGPNNQVNDKELLTDLQAIHYKTSILRDMNIERTRLMYTRKLNGTAKMTLLQIQAWLMEGQSIKWIREQLAIQIKDAQDAYEAECERRRQKKQQKEEQKAAIEQEMGTMQQRFDIVKEHNLNYKKDFDRITEIFQQQKRISQEE